jgi:hypothetical protein
MPGETRIGSEMNVHLVTDFCIFVEAWLHIGW